MHVGSGHSTLLSRRVRSGCESWVMVGLRCLTTGLDDCEAVREGILGRGWSDCVGRLVLVVLVVMGGGGGRW